MVKKKKEKSRFTKKQKIWITVAGIFLALILIYDFTIPRNIYFYAKWVQCGQRPVGSRGSGLFNVGVPHYEKVSLFRLFRGHIDYYCSPLEAERAGYSADPDNYRFPHKWELGEYRKRQSE